MRSLRIIIHVSNLQTINHFAMLQMRFDDFIDIVLIDKGVPNAFRVDHDAGAFFAAIQAAGVVDAHFALT
jgi:hypothetical protein